MSAFSHQNFSYKKYHHTPHSTVVHDKKIFHVLWYYLTLCHRRLCLCFALNNDIIKLNSVWRVGMALKIKLTTLFAETVLSQNEKRLRWPQLTSKFDDKEKQSNTKPINWQWLIAKVLNNNLWRKVLFRVSRPRRFNVSSTMGLL
jgi:hypothetical protein